MQDINLIRRVAWSFHRTTGLPYDELFGEASIAYVECLTNYDESKGKRSTLAWHSMTNHLIDYLNNTKYDEPDKVANTITPEKEVMFKEALYSLSKDAQSVCEMIFTSPHDFLTHAPKLSRGKVKDRLRESGWSWGRIWKSFSEIKSLINEM